MKAIHQFFLSGYDDASYFERKKATYLYYIILSALVFITMVLLGQAFFHVGAIYFLGNILALNGVVVSLLFFKNKQTHAAGHLMSCSALVMVILHNIVRDSFEHDPSMRYRIYIDMTSLMGVFFLITSFFREKKVIYGYTVVFAAILTTHTLVIDHQLGHMPRIRLFIWEHYATVTTGVFAVAIIITWMLEYVDALMQQNKQYARQIESHNEVLEKVVKERTRELESTNENLREFAHIVSHDLKEPLRTISGFVTLINKELRKQGYNEEEIEEYIAYVKNGTSQMEQLISDILTYSKLNVVEKNFDELNMAAVFKEVKSNLAKAIYESEGEVLVTGAENVKGAHHLLLQLFQNLVSNAIKYRSDERELKVVIGCKEHNGKLLYFVQDNGIGISEQYHHTIFQAFKRLHSRAKYEGTGVGLAICKKIVEIHDGQIWVESKEGEGSTFFFTLPKAQTEVPAINPVVHAA